MTQDDLTTARGCFHGLLMALAILVALYFIVRLFI